MAKAVWNETVLAESDKVERVGKDIYFPPDSINRQYFKKSDLHTTCPWKGLASYYDIIVNGKKNTNAAWYYPEPKKAASNITNYVAFWKGVKIEQQK